MHPPQLQKTLLECARFKKPDSAFLPTPSECKAFQARLRDITKDMPEEERPLIAFMGLDQDIEFVDCALGKVPKGCPLSYHYPLPSDKDFQPHDDAPPQPCLPLQSQTVPHCDIPMLLANERDFLNKMTLTWEAAYYLEISTRQQEDFSQEVQNGRLVGWFADLFLLKDKDDSGERLALKIKRPKRVGKQATIEKEERIEVLREYCRLTNKNWYPCGLAVHPNAPWLAASPDGLIYDPSEDTAFGIIHVKHVPLPTFSSSKLVSVKEGALHVNTRSAVYRRIQGELLVTGTLWCDLLLWTTDYMLIQRIYRDADVIDTLKTKSDKFFFQYYLPSLCPREELPNQNENEGEMRKDQDMASTAPKLSDFQE
uniref:YqaJ viral recombinase domain-containing protein n=1 Tax=Knipowitschia caucasica TaxID=637954 RepID=A0AAV2M530_KNICA